MKTVYINGYFCLEQIKGGVNRFAHEILCALDSLTIKNNLTIKFVLLVPKLQFKRPELKSIEIRTIGLFKQKYLWEQISLPLYVGDSFLINLANFAPIYKTNQLCIIHDALIFRYPGSYSWKFRIVTQYFHRQLVKRCKYIGTVSNFSAKEIHNVVGQPKNPIVILGNSAEKFTCLAITDDYLKTAGLESQGYILSVFSQKNSQYKNIDNYLKAIAQINFKFVCVGNVELNEINLPDNLVQLGYVSDNQLKTLYLNSYATLVPSVYEGFGIPLLEAMASGSPLILSDIPVFKEITSNGAIYFDPNNTQDMVDKINQLICNSDIRNYLVNYGYNQVKNFSWQEYARKIYQLLDNR